MTRIPPVPASSAAPRRPAERAPPGLAPAPARTWATTALRYLPGLLLLLVGVVGTFAQTGLRSVATATGTRLPDVEYVLWAIVIGLVIRNTVGVPALFRPGVGTYESG